MNNFFKNKPTCVVLCAGKGTRLNSPNIPKSLNTINNKPILKYIIDYWRNFTNKFIFVIGYKGNMIKDYVKNFNIEAKFVYQKKLKGIGHATLLTERYIKNNFILVLGDCITRGRFYFKDMEMGIGVYKTENKKMIMNSYNVIVEKNKIIKVIEKPKKVRNNLCGMGIYFFNKKIFDYIKKTPPSKIRNEIEITDAIQNTINDNNTIKPVYFNGFYININYPEDIKSAEPYLK